MLNKIFKFLTVLLTCLSVAPAQAYKSAGSILEVSSIFQDHMVLQRDLPVSVWGRSEAGSLVTVDFYDQKKSTVTNEKGQWELQLSPLKASFLPEQMTISSNNKKIMLNDILVGEVWICSGQSNMQFAINGAKDVKTLKATAKHIRSFEVKRTVALTEQTAVEGNWNVSIPNSAVAFSFAYYLQQRADVPIGIILSAWGSSSLEAWMPRDLTTKLPYFDGIMQAFDNDEKRIKRISDILSASKPWSKKDDIYLRRQPNILFNAMMKPIAPYTTRGLVWYQGERNSQSMNGLITTPWFKNNSGMLKYKEALQTWIKRYRQEWNNNEMNFLVVMLPRYQAILDSSPTKDIEHPNAHSWAWMRESQLAAPSLGNVSVVNTIDLGHPTNIHPRDKLPIGQRLAKLAARDTLDQNIEAQGPVLKKATVLSENITIHFEHAKGLKTTNGKPPNEFWLANKSQQWVKADANIVNDTIVLTSLNINNPLYVRYAFTGYPEVNLINHAGLPAQPFRTDSFKP